MLGCTATHGQQPTNKTPADSGGVIIGTSAGGVSTITSSSSGCQQTSMDNNCWVSFNMTHTHNLLQQIKELAGMLADVLEQEEADGTKRVHATLPANSKVEDRYPPHRVSISHLAVRR